MSSQARNLQPRVLESIRRCALWSPGDTVAVAVSGGVDSLVLLHLLHRTVSAHGGTLTVLSADHGLRKESAAEVEGVRAVAQSLDIPFVGVRLNIEPGPNLAERARDARKEALLGLGTDRIATGHHEDDQAETVLYHLLRGSGMRGLRGMQPRDGQWVRPLLFESRAVIQTWAEADGLSWVEDPSNPHSQRGQLRRLMPLLDEVPVARWLGLRGSWPGKMLSWWAWVTRPGLQHRRGTGSVGMGWLRCILRFSFGFSGAWLGNFPCGPGRWRP
jgi:tRNA(Ile)-lysidine synthase